VRGVSLHSRSVRGAWAMDIFTTIVSRHNKSIAGIHGQPQDARSHGLGQRGPGVDQGHEIGVKRIISCINCTAFRSAYFRNRHFSRGKRSLCGSYRGSLFRLCETAGFLVNA